MGYWEDYEERNTYEDKQIVYNCFNPEKEVREPSKSSRIRRRDFINSKNK